ncbi:MAG: GAF domain-containing sensor histidine kinase [Myxococcales bacterium]
MPGEQENAGLEVARFLRERSGEVVDLWQELTEERVPSVSTIPREQWRDHVPQLVRRLATLVEQRALGEPMGEEVPQAPEVVALTRLAQGLAFAEHLDELLLLRHAATRLWAEMHQPSTPAATDILEAALDRLIRETAQRYVDARMRVLSALDRVAEVGLVGEEDGRRAVLQRLVEVIVDEVPDADTVGLLIREGNNLHLQAAVGLERDRTRQAFSVKVGEGFAGRVAATAQPLMLRAPQIASMVTSEALRSLGLRVLFGVPTPHLGEVLGVLHIGSRTVDEFNPLALQVFTAVSDRVGMVVARERHRALQEGIIRMVSHDLRSPLGTILMQAQLLQRQAGDPELVKRGGIIQRSARTMEVMIKDLVDTARHETGQLRIDPCPVEIRAFLEELVARFAGVIAIDRVRLQFAGALPEAWADPDRLERILANLIGNALKYSEPHTPVIVRGSAWGDGVSISVQDFGIGIEPEELPRVFDRYYRAARAKGTEGLGLGLAISRVLVEAHGGSLSAESEPGKGSTFRLWLPAVPVRHEEPSPPGV